MDCTGATVHLAAVHRAVISHFVAGFDRKDEADNTAGQGRKRQYGENGGQNSGTK